MGVLSNWQKLAAKVGGDEETTLDNRSRISFICDCTYTDTYCIHTTTFGAVGAGSSARGVGEIFGASTLHQCQGQEASVP